MKHISWPFHPPLCNRFITLCCIFQSVTSSICTCFFLW